MKRLTADVETGDDEGAEQPVRPSRTALGKRTARDEEEPSAPSAPRGNKKTTGASRTTVPVEIEGEPKKKRIRKLGGALGADSMPTFEWGSNVSRLTSTQDMDLHFSCWFIISGCWWNRDPRNSISIGSSEGAPSIDKRTRGPFET